MIEQPKVMYIKVMLPLAEVVIAYPAAKPELVSFVPSCSLHAGDSALVYAAMIRCAESQYFQFFFTFLGQRTATAYLKTLNQHYFQHQINFPLHRQFCR